MTSPNFPPKRISQLPVATGVASDSVFVGVVDGTTYQVPLDVLPFPTATGATFTGPITVPDGTAASPSIVLGASAGFFRSTTATNGIGFSVAAEEVAYLERVSNVSTRLNGGAPASSTSNGRSLTVRAGAAGSTSGNGGTAVLSGGVPTEGNGGSVSIAGAAGVGTNRDGGAVTITGGASTGSGTAGAITLQSSNRVNLNAGVHFFRDAAGTNLWSVLNVGGTNTDIRLIAQGAPTATANGIDFGLYGSEGGSSGGDGGSTYVAAGPAFEGNGGSVFLNAQSGVGTNRSGGSVVAVAGNPTGSGSYGSFSVQTATGGTLFSVSATGILTASNLAISGSVTVGGTASVAGNLSVAAALTVAGTASMTGAVGLASTLAVSGAVNLATTTLIGATGQVGSIRLSVGGSDNTTPQIAMKGSDNNWYSRAGQVVNGGNIATFYSVGGQWSVNGSTYSCTKDLDGSFPSMLVAVANQVNSNATTQFAVLNKAAGSTTTDGSITNLFNVNGNGNVVVGSVALATNASAGFPWVPSMPGNPSGSPTAPYTNAAAITVQSNATDSRIWVLVGTTWKSVILT